MACLLALKQHQDCLSLISKEVKQGTATADVYILRARIHNFFQKVGEGRWEVYAPPTTLGAPSVPQCYRLSTSPEVLSLQWARSPQDRGPDTPCHPGR
jgi:hypothetical protein